MPEDRSRWTTVFVLSLLIPFACGCQIGPAALKMGHSEYSSAVQQIGDEQMLLNLVRLRYRDTPVWLEVTSISTQFEFSSSGQISGALNENVGPGDGKNPNVLGLQGNVGYSERPTITYTILGGEDFLTQMLAPINVGSISLLAESGWRSDRVLRLTVERLNGLKNAPRASGPTPSEAPQFRAFLEAVCLMEKLARDHVIEFEYATRIEEIGSPVLMEQVNGGHVVLAAKSGTEFHARDDGRMRVLIKEKRILIMRFAERALDSAEATRLRELLRLDQDGLRYDLLDPSKGEYDPIEPNRALSNISVDTRSLMGVLYYLSNAVEVPPEDKAAGPVTDTVDEEGHPFDWAELLDDLFVVKYGKSRPSAAAVAVRYRGLWFYTEDNDESTKSTFALLHQLASLQAGDVESTAPVLTLPVGR